MKHLLLLLILMGQSSLALAQDGEWQFRFGPRIWGGYVGARYVLEEPEVDGVESSLTGLMSAAYESVGYQRLSDGTLLTIDPAAPDVVRSYNRLDLLWQLGIQQGILPRREAPQDKLVAFALYRGRYRLPFTADSATIAASNLPQVGPVLQGSVVSGVAFSTLSRSPITRSLSGATAEFVIEWGPGFLHNELVGNADFSRTTLTGSGFLPLVELPPKDGMNQFALYGGALAFVDWATGPVIPSSVRSTVGGRSPRSAPGGIVRGYGSGRFDATFKAGGNIEVRASLPSLGLPSIVPGIVVFTDGAYYADTDAVSPETEQNTGVLLSSGAGLSIDLFDVAALVFYSAYAWTETNVEGGRWVPFALGFGFHF